MPRKEFYQPKNPFETPEPHGKPGYTGYFPKSGPKRIFQMAEVYESWTHDVMEQHPIAGLRYGIILNTDESLERRLEDEALTWKHEQIAQNIKLRRNMKVGYTGYIPRKRFLYGKSYSEECTKAIALLEKLRYLDIDK